jgi:hypothetical protein
MQKAQFVRANAFKRNISFVAGNILTEWAKEHLRDRMEHDRLFVAEEPSKLQKLTPVIVEGKS